MYQVNIHIKGGYMNPIKFHKKLRLNKKTIAHLGNDEMMNASGGELVETVKICPITWGQGSCPTLCETQPGPLDCQPWICQP
jgi:hypothetical protein